MNMFKSNIACRTLLLMNLLLMFCMINVDAQRLEVHANKDFSSNTIASKAWGVGGAIDFDQWVKHITFRANFNWAAYRPKDDNKHHDYQRLCGGISSFYSHKVGDKINVHGGIELNYTHLTHAYLYQQPDTVIIKGKATRQIGDFIGLGVHVGASYKLRPRLNIVLNIIPTYLIMVSTKSSTPEVKPEYKKGIWMFPIQLGLSYQLYKPD